MFSLSFEKILRRITRTGCEVENIGLGQRSGESKLEVSHEAERPVHVVHVGAGNTRSGIKVASNREARSIQPLH